MLSTICSASTSSLSFAAYAVEVSEVPYIEDPVLIQYTGVLLLPLQVLETPIKGASVNRDGMTYVVSRIDWYRKLSSLLSDK